MRCSCLLVVLVGAAAGCSAIPDIVHEPQYHNPFPQLYRVAVLPFFNLSENPHVDGERFALAYATELQKIRGFEVMPLGVVKQQLRALEIQLDEATDCQGLARLLGVDAVIRGGVTEFTSYYPPRLGLSVDWFAANPGFHPIPPGYGLPWGTTQQEYIPDALVWEAEFALAREQLETQTPLMSEQPLPAEPAQDEAEERERPPPAAGAEVAGKQPLPAAGGSAGPADTAPGAATDPELPPDWPDPRGFVPPPPRPDRPRYFPQKEAIISHTRLYDGHDEAFTQRLANYFYFRDDARFGGWQAYLQRSDDFIRFCCHLHLTETLAARGGVGQSRVVWRWPIGRYER